MIVPYKPVFLQKATRKFRYIVIHDSTCKFKLFNKAKIDTPKSQILSLRNYNWVFNNEFELPYHFVCEKIGKDFETVMATPFCYFCEYEDIPQQFLPSIHICIVGNYSIQQPSQRLYQQIGYRSIASVVKWFKIPLTHIYLHHEISENKEIGCPGSMIDKNKLLSTIRPLILMRS